MKEHDYAKESQVEEILWSIRTFGKASTSCTPFMLMYIVEALIRVEVGETNMNIQGYDLDQNEKAYVDNLGLLLPMRKETQMRIELYKASVNKLQNRTVNHQPLKPSDFVLRCLEAI